MEETTINNILQDIEVDPFNPYEYEMSTSEIIYRFVLVYLVSTIHIILCISILASNGLFFYVMYKFKRLRTRTNYILLNFFICLTYFSICITVISILRSYFPYMLLSEFVFLLTFGLLDAAFLFALLLAIEWFLSANCYRVFTIYKKIYKSIIAIIYFVAIMNVVSFVFVHGYLLIEIMTIMSAFCGLVYLLCILGLAVLNIVKMRKSYSPEALKTLYALWISNVFFLMWLPILSMLVIRVLLYMTSESFNFSTIVIMACMAYLTEFIAMSAPIVAVVLLGKLDKNFKMSYDYVFKRSVRTYLQSNTNLDEEN